MTRMFRPVLIAAIALLVAVQSDVGGQPGGAGGGPGGDPPGGGAEGGTGHEGKGPCVCDDDIPDMRAMLYMVKRTRAAWKSVLGDMYGNHGPNDGEEAKLLFEKYMGWNHADVKAVGKVSRTGDIAIDPEFKQLHCDSIVEGVGEHESAHFWYFTSRSLVIFMMSPKSVGMVLAKSEVDARNVQARYLSKAIKALLKKCGRDNSADDDVSDVGLNQSSP